jgi:hypothetical protein
MTSLEVWSTTLTDLDETATWIPVGLLLDDVVTAVVSVSARCSVTSELQGSYRTCRYGVLVWGLWDSLDNRTWHFVTNGVTRPFSQALETALETAGDSAVPVMADDVSRISSPLGRHAQLFVQAGAERRSKPDRPGPWSEQSSAFGQAARVPHATINIGVRTIGGARAFIDPK